jgi:hypothetical protein
MDCPICCDAYTSVVRKPVTCPYCDYAACTVCMKKYLTEGALDAHCMACRRSWNDEFLDLNFTRAFRTGPYKKHREDVLMEREISILPTRQARVEAKLKVREVEVEIKKVNNELAELDKMRTKVLHSSHRLTAQITRYTAESEGRPPPAWTLTEGERAAPTEKAKFIMKCPDSECRGFLSTAYKCGTCQRWACPDCLVIKGKDKDVEHTCDPGVKESVAMIIKESHPCPKCGERISKVDGCFAADTEVLLWNGGTKMSQDIIIGDQLVGDDGTIRIVEATCSGEDEMFEVSQTRGMSYTVNSKHTLVLKRKDGTVVEIIMDDYLTLTSSEKDELYGYKLDNTLSSISVKSVGRGKYFGWNVGGNHNFMSCDDTILRNCDQMYCIDCHTAFSWNTGQIVNGVIHNPHYYDYLRKLGNGTAPRNAGDVPCGGVPYYGHIDRAIRSFSVADKRSIIGIHRITSEIADERLRTYQGGFNINDNGDLGVMYLMKEMTKEAMKSELAKRELKRNKHMAIRAILEMFVNTSTMMLNNLVTTTPETEESRELLILEYNNLRRYVNDSLMGVSKMKNCSVPQIGEKWEWKPFNKVAPKTRAVATVAAVAAASLTGSQDPAEDIDE